MKIIDNAELGNKIKALREEKKETQDDLKKVLNFNNRQQVSYIERGDRLPTLEQICILAQHYSVTADYLLGLSDVATNDTNLKAVCDYTGLSEKAIKDLHFIKTYYFDNDNIDILNSIISYFVYSGNEVIKNIINQLNKISKENSENAKLLEEINKKQYFTPDIQEQLDRISCSDSTLLNGMIFELQQDFLDLINEYTNYKEIISEQKNNKINACDIEINSMGIFLDEQE